MIYPSYTSHCRHFRGDLPCRPHKEEGVHCDSCPHYLPTDRNILIIKLGAIGDVIRTTPLLHRLRADYPNARIWWLTRTPEILPRDVDVAMNFSLESMISILAVNFDLLLNLDKDREACALADRIEASVKKGFILQNGVCAPIDQDARHKFLTGLFDDVNQANTRHYLDEIFEVAGFTWQGEEYILENTESWPLPTGLTRPVIGLNTGCGGRWTSRLWPEASWRHLIGLLRERGWTPLLLGGAQEDTFNQALADATGAVYLGHSTLPRFTALMRECDVIVSAVTMAMHLAIGLRKPLILFNNIFNRHEFELYGRGEVLEPSRPCTCFFSPTCTNPEYRCMEHLEPERVADAIGRWIPRSGS